MRAIGGTSRRRGESLGPLSSMTGLPHPPTGPGPGQLRIRLAAPHLNMQTLWGRCGVVGSYATRSRASWSATSRGGTTRATRFMGDRSFAIRKREADDETLRSDALPHPRLCRDPSAITPSPPRATSSRSRIGSLHQARVRPTCAVELSAPFTRGRARPRVGSSSMAPAWCRTAATAMARAAVLY